MFPRKSALKTFIDLWPLAAIVGLFALNVLIAGVDVVWISRVSLDRGRMAGWSTSLGASLSDLLYASASFAGLSAAIQRAPRLLPLLGLAGGLWLAYSGARAAAS